MPCIQHLRYLELLPLRHTSHLYIITDIALHVYTMSVNELHM